MQTIPPISILEERLGYRFSDPRLLENAMCHSSYVNEQPDVGKDNECLEFLGDAVLNLVVGHLLMKRYPDEKEGNLSRMRAALVNETQLADIARDLTLGRFLRLGKGEDLTNGREKNSILADAFEAVLAAVYLDGGFARAFSIVESRFSGLIDRAKTPTGANDAKSRLQELSQTNQGAMPKYRVIAEEGPDHDKTFCVRVHVSGRTADGVGKSKKAAEQEAARNALIFWDDADDDS